MGSVRTLTEGEGVGGDATGEDAGADAGDGAAGEGDTGEDAGAAVEVFVSLAPPPQAVSANRAASPQVACNAESRKRFVANAFGVVPPDDGVSPPVCMSTIMFFIPLSIC
jgi:hypothetical protein